MRVFRCLGLLSAALMSGVLFIACGDSAADNNTIGSGNASNRGGGGKGGSSSGGQAGGGIFGGASGMGTGGGGIDDSGVCAAVSKESVASPVDLYLMVDQSTSMTKMLPSGQNIWQAIVAAIQGFVRAPEAAGIGVGIQYFGIGTGAPACDVAQYAVPEVPIGALPGVAAAIEASLANHGPRSFTPTGAALQGALQYGATWAAQNPTRTTMVVLATDGYPTECMPQSMSEIATLAGAALNGTNRVYTFVIGIGSLWNLNTVAAAGGTREAFVIDDTSPTVAQQFTDALLKIAASPLGCEFPMPTADGGMMIDIAKINVDFAPSNGMPPRKLVKVDSEADCSKTPDGWYYDHPTQPSRIMICPTTCKSFGAGKLDILLGCGTRTGPF